MTRFLICALLFTSGGAWAQTDHTLIRRISVFPIKTAPEFQQVADDAWWELRETLTRDKRFLVASKNFLMQKDVYQSRSVLSPADAIILGKLLDANALITTYLDDRVLNMRVYEGEYGRPLWEHSFTLQPSLMASIPYQGFVTTDPLKGRPLYQEGRRLLARAEIGTTAEVDVGDPVQLIRVFSDNLKPLFTNGAAIEVFAEGRIVEHDREMITIELDRLNHAAGIQDGTMVRLPRELKRLEQLYSIQDSLRNKIDPEFFSPGMTSQKQRESETKPLISSLVFIGNLAAFLLLAF
jgi:hypothetical protein